jgi:hypothetical protein
MPHICSIWQCNLFHLNFKRQCPVSGNNFKLTVGEEGEEGVAREYRDLDEGNVGNYGLGVQGSSVMNEVAVARKLGDRMPSTKALLARATDVAPVGKKPLNRGLQAKRERESRAREKARGVSRHIATRAHRPARKVSAAKVATAGGDNDSDESDDEGGEAVEAHFQLTSLSEAYEQSEVFDGAVQEGEVEGDEKLPGVLQASELQAYDEVRALECPRPPGAVKRP